MSNHEQTNTLPTPEANEIYDDNLEQWREAAHHDLGESAVGFAMREDLTEITEVAEIPVSHERAEKGQDVRTVIGRAERLAEAGMERTPFNGMEVKRAIDGYYVDHEVTLYAVGAIVKGEMNPDELSSLVAEGEQGTIIHNDQLRKALVALDSLNRSGNQQQRDLLANITLEALYTEPSVGQLTLDDETMQRVAREKAELTMLVNPRSNSHLSIEALAGEQLKSIENAKQRAGNETRNAGQLLFHNTAYGHGVSQGGNIRGRARQGSTQEKVSITTAELEGHSILSHWSELYDPINYKSLEAESMQSKTIAVPLGEIIKNAPYARGLEFAVVESKADRTVDTLDIGLADGSTVTGMIGPGASDMMGGSEAKVDRVFWASKDSIDEGAQYDIAVHGGAIMRMNHEKGFQEPVVYEIQSDSDRLRSYNGNMRNDERVAAARADMDAGLSQREMLREHGSTIDTTATGYGFPNRVVVEDLKLSTQSPASQWIKGGAQVRLAGAGERSIATEDQAEAAAESIRAIQRESVARFADTYVVPLRAIDTRLGSFSDNLVAHQYGERLSEQLRFKANNVEQAA